MLGRLLLEDQPPSGITKGTAADLRGFEAIFSTCGLWLASHSGFFIFP